MTPVSGPRYPMKNLIAASALALLFPIGLALLGVTKTLGAHIWWDVKTILIGAPIGLCLGFAAALLPISKTTRLITFLILTLASFALTKYGQITFANSYAEDQLAGALWYFGWILTGACAAATLFSALKR